MARIARLVVPGVPHHVVQRGNRRQRTFFGARDFDLYRTLLARKCRDAGIEVWAYCLMPNHVHLIVVPHVATSLARGLGGAHRAYTAVVNRREGWRGCLWQGRFASYPMDEAHLLAAARYLLVNPVRAGLVGAPADWPYSSVRAHLSDESDGLVDPTALCARVEDWFDFLAAPSAPVVGLQIRSHAASGLPAGSSEFVSEVEVRTGRTLRHSIEARAGRLSGNPVHGLAPFGSETGLADPPAWVAGRDRR